MALIRQNKDGILYAVAYERGLSHSGFVYLQAESYEQAHMKVFQSKMFPKDVRVVGIAPAVGVQYTDPQTSKEADRVKLYV